jgi:hypothetical protein
MFKHIDKIWAFIFHGEAAENVKTIKYCHRRYTLWHHKEKGKLDWWLWTTDNGAQVGPIYHSEEACEWSFGEWGDMIDNSYPAPDISKPSSPPAIPKTI